MWKPRKFFIIIFFLPLNPNFTDLYGRVTAQRNSTNAPRILLGVGGWTDSAGDKYSRMSALPINRGKFVRSVVELLELHGFQGLSLEWAYPACWQSDCRVSATEDKANFVELLRDLRREFDTHKPPLVLATALSGYKEVIDRGYDLPAISNLVDFMTVMAYDYHGAWEPKTAHLAPLYGSPEDVNPYYNVVSITL